MKSKFILVSLLFSMLVFPSHLFAATCFSDGAGNMHCDDGRFLHGDGAGNMHGSDGTFYHGDGTGNYHGSDGSFMHGHGGAISGGNAYGGDTGGGAARRGGAGNRRAARALAQKQQCESDCNVTYNQCVQQNYCYDMCRSRCLEKGRYCMSRCNQ